MALKFSDGQNLPNKAISIKQPYAWLIVNGIKDIENRSWYTKYRGPILIHAGKTWVDDDDAIKLAKDHYEVTVPDRDEMDSGGIVGIATIKDCVDHHHSKWYNGPWGFVLTDARELPFMEYKGQLGIFTVQYRV